MKDISLFIKKLYAFTFIPVYYYSNESLRACQPPQAVYYPLPEKYISVFLQSDREVSFLMTESHCFYGFVREKSTGAYLIAGPMTAISYSDTILRSMRKDFLVAEGEADTFYEYLRSIPPKNLNDFLSYLSFLNMELNDTNLTPVDARIPSPADNTVEEKVSKTYADVQYEDKESSYYNNSLDIERRFIACIEKGDLPGLKRFFSENYALNVGTFADNNLRQMKNEIIVSVALCCRAAIRGGLSSETAFHLSDSYIQQLEVTNNPEVIKDFSVKMMVDYTTRVAECILPPSPDMVLGQAIQYVQQNTNRHITVADVAEHVGFSRAYLSHKFKETLGFDLSALIRRCKLEEAKELLRYTNKSIGDISNYLCFSSQSYFQNCFKKQYGITPQKYREGKEL